MVLAYRLTGDPRYLAGAIAETDQVVSEAETRIAQGKEPFLAGDSYHDVGGYIEDLALTYDHGFDQLTPEQRQRWTALAEQAVFNVWHPSEASWNGVPHTWTGWAICDPGNNYHFNFLRATMLWALATQNTAWFDFLQAQKFGPLLDYYAQFPGGGPAEGTGYGTALNDLFGDYIYWKASTGEDLASLSPHVRETIDYWVHATVPTLDRLRAHRRPLARVDPEHLRLPGEPRCTRPSLSARARFRRGMALGGSRTTRSTASTTSSTSRATSCPTPMRRRRRRS
jgi:hypothetical protein